jgi:hypothetical protein
MNLRRGLVIGMISVVLCLALQGIGAAGSRLSSASASSTRLVHVYPFTVSGNAVASGYHVVGRGAASCWTTSNVLGSAGWRCMSKSYIYDPCIQADNHLHKVACPVGTNGPYQIKVFASQQSLPFTSSFGPLPIWALRLGNGAYCTRVTGAVYWYRGHPADFGCNTGHYCSAWGSSPIKATDPRRILYACGLHPARFTLARVRVAFN